MNSGRASKSSSLYRRMQMPGSDAPAATRALVGRRLRHGFDRESLHLESAAVTRDARGTGVDDVADTRHGQRCFRDVGGEHDPASRTTHRRPFEDLVLLGRRQPRVERQHLGAAQVELAERVGGVVDLALARQEHQHIAGSLVRELLDGVEDPLNLITIRLIRLVVDQRSVPHLDRKGPARHFDHRCGLTIGCEVLGKPLGVDRGAGDDHLQVGALRQELLEVAEDEIDVEAALVRLVDDQRVVAAQHPIALDLGEQNAVGHHLHERGLADLVGEAHGVADVVAELRSDLLGDPLGDRAGGHPARLRVADHPVDATSGLEAQLRQLGALPRPGLAGDDHHLVLADRGEDLVAPLGDRQRVRVRRADRGSPAPQRRVDARSSCLSWPARPTSLAARPPLPPRDSRHPPTHPPMSQTAAYGHLAHRNRTAIPTDEPNRRIRSPRSSQPDQTPTDEPNRRIRSPRSSLGWGRLVGEA